MAANDVRYPVCVVCSNFYRRFVQHSLCQERTVCVPDHPLHRGAVGPFVGHDQMLFNGVKYQCCWGPTL